MRGKVKKALKVHFQAALPCFLGMGAMRVFGNDVMKTLFNVPTGKIMNRAG